ncbi:MAG: lysophospholipid acyltransferase family protein [Egibacteraceae bacterium]
MRSGERAPGLYRALHAVLPALLNAVWRPHVDGREHIPAAGPAILAANHLSFLDSVFLPAALDRPLYYLGKSDYFDGWRRHFFENVGVMPVARQGGDAGEASLRRGEEILRGGRLLGIYPEGTRSPDGRLYRGKTGLVRLALRTGAPVIPVGMIGTDRVLPTGAKVPRVHKVVIKVGEHLDLAARYGRDPDPGQRGQRPSAGSGSLEDDRFVLRSATDELMYELMMLSGQSYVDEYAAKVKSGEVSIGSGDLAELGGLLEDDRPLQQAS